MMNTNGGRPGPGIMFVGLEEAKKAQEERLAMLGREAWKRMNANKTIIANGATGMFMCRQDNVVEQKKSKTTACVPENHDQSSTSDSPHIQDVARQLKEKLTISPEVMARFQYKSFSNSIPTTSQRATTSLEAMLRMEEVTDSSWKKEEENRVEDPSHVSDLTFQKLKNDRYEKMLRAQDLTISKYQKIVELMSERLEAEKKEKRVEKDEKSDEGERSQNDLEYLAAINKNLKEENTNLNKKYTTKYQSFRETNETKNSKIRELEKSLKEKDAQIKDLRETNRELHNASERDKKSHEELIRKKDSKIQHMQLCEKESDAEHRQKLGLLNATITNYEETRVAARNIRKDIDELKETINSKNARFAKLENDYAQANRYITLLHNKLAEMKKNEKKDDEQVKSD
ncbi:hypothetical protein CAEBREN_10906 [Caenorhabditis brenneri]|uniref:Uncharacterized protein n=1 Tax=Caenorhabditis brenneri TaxID=135651 RepID=G0NZK4_CAEBE|nr:hypothetical protein CAEBREN_10906 [Caenorhabditis brenneri]